MDWPYPHYSRKVRPSNPLTHLGSTIQRPGHAAAAAPATLSNCRERLSRCRSIPLAHHGTTIRCSCLYVPLCHHVPAGLLSYQQRYQSCLQPDGQLTSSCFLSYLSLLPYTSQCLDSTQLQLIFTVYRDNGQFTRFQVMASQVPPIKNILANFYPAK
jgi:hypothetical protein